MNKWSGKSKGPREQRLEAAKFLIEKFGYVVIATAAGSGEYEVGDRLQEIWAMDVGQPFVVLGKATRSQFDIQRRALAIFWSGSIPQITNGVLSSGTNFWKFVTD